MIELLHGAVLGLVQGITEFFPVSSSGHLILVPSLLGWRDQGLAFDTILHLGTLAALLWAFRKDIADLLSRAFGRKDKAAWRFILQVIVAAIPGLLFGALFGDMIEQTLRQPLLVAFDLAFWGLILLIADRIAAKRQNAVTDVHRVTWVQTMVVGLSQAVALFPGTSRSGITMTGGLFSGLDRKTAVTFSFFVSIPTIAAAGGYGLLKMLRAGVPEGEGGMLIVGFLVAAIAGAWAIQFLRSYVSKHSLAIFVWYRLALAAIVLLVTR